MQHFLSLSLSLLLPRCPSTLGNCPLQVMGFCHLLLHRAHVTNFYALETLFPLIESYFSDDDFLFFFFGLPIVTQCFGGKTVFGKVDLIYTLLPLIRWTLNG